MLHKREGRHAEKAHKVGIFVTAQVDSLYVLRLKGAAEVDSLQAGMGFFIRLLLNPNRLLSKQPE
jgi:hypothetical protein